MTHSSHINPDLGQGRSWHKEDGFLHGYLNGLYYRMVCTPQEFEAIRELECNAQERTLDDDEVWWAMDSPNYVDPWHADFGEFESASPFEEDLDEEARRRILAFNMYLDPQTTTWYGLGKSYEALMRIRRQEDRRKALKQRCLALGLDPKMEQKPETRRLRAAALAFGLNPYTATWKDLDSKNIKLYKILLPDDLVWRARKHLSNRPTSVEDLLQKVLVQYLDNQDEESNKSDEGSSRDRGD